MLYYRFVVHPVQPFHGFRVIQRRASDSVDVLRFALAELQAPQVLHPQSGQGFGPRKGIVGFALEGLTGSMGFYEQRADDAGDVGSDLLAENSQHQGFKHRGGMRHVQPMESLSYGRHRRVALGQSVEHVGGGVGRGLVLETQATMQSQVNFIHLAG